MIAADAAVAIETLIADLASRFGITRRIDITWAASLGRADGRAYHHRFNDGAYRIALVARTTFGLRALAIHEFAHILDYERCDRLRVQFQAGRLSNNHSEVYYRGLLEVLDAAGVARSAHPWSQEYATLNAYARRDGYTTERTPREAARYAASAAAAESGVRIGATVEWRSPKWGPKRGVVVSAYQGCRAKVRTADGAFWMIPPSWLRVVEGEARA